MEECGSHLNLGELWKMVSSLITFKVSLHLCVFFYINIYYTLSESQRWFDDAYVYCNSWICLDQVNLPPPEPQPEGEMQALPYVFVGDEAFPLKRYMMRPFPGRSLDCMEKRVFNYRLSRARRVIENAFGKSTEIEALCIFIFVIVAFKFKLFGWRRQFQNRFHVTVIGTSGKYVFSRFVCSYVLSRRCNPA